MGKRKRERWFQFNLLYLGGIITVYGRRTASKNGLLTSNSVPIFYPSWGCRSPTFNIKPP